MDEEMYCCLGCILAIFIIFAGFSALGTISDWTNNDGENIYLDDVNTQITNYSFENKDGKIIPDYLYSVSFILKNVSSRFEDSEVVISLYENDKLITTEDGSQNVSFTIGYDAELEYNYVPIRAMFSLDDLINVTHCVVIVVDDGKLVFNATHPFNMRNYEDYEPINYTNDLENENDSNSSDTSDNDDSCMTYVASSNSDKFHKPSCSQAKKIKAENKITFTSRDEALNSGYHSCSICNP